MRLIKSMICCGSLAVVAACGTHKSADNNAQPVTAASDVTPEQQAEADKLASNAPAAAIVRVPVDAKGLPTGAPEMKVYSGTGQIDSAESLSGAFDTASAPEKLVSSTDELDKTSSTQSWTNYAQGGGTGGYPSTGAGGYPSTGTGGYPSTGAGGYPSTGTGGYPSTGTGGYPSTGAGGYPSTGAGGYPSTGAGGYPSTGTGGYPSSGSGGYGNSGYGNSGYGGSGYGGYDYGYFYNTYRPVLYTSGYSIPYGINRPSYYNYGGYNYYCYRPSYQSYSRY